MLLLMASPKQRTLTRKNITIMSVMIFISMKIMTITVMTTIIIITATTGMITANYILGFKQRFKEK
jgi:hypothetical protein